MSGFCNWMCACRGVSVLRHGVFGDLHVPGALLCDAEQKYAGLQCFQRKQQQSQRGCCLQLRYLPEASHAADCQHLQPAVHCSHPGHERYIQLIHLYIKERTALVLCIPFTKKIQFNSRRSTTELSDPLHIYIKCW